MKSGIERAFLHAELVIRRDQDVATDAITVFRSRASVFRTRRSSVPSRESLAVRVALLDV